MYTCVMICGANLTLILSFLYRHTYVYVYKRMIILYQQQQQWLHHHLPHSKQCYNKQFIIRLFLLSYRGIPAYHRTTGALETSRAISPMKIKCNFLQSYLYYRHSKEKTDEGQPSPNFIFVSSAVLILTSIRKWEQSEMFREMAVGSPARLAFAYFIQL